MRAAEVVTAYLEESAIKERSARQLATFRELAADYMHWLATDSGAKPTTLRDHAYKLAEPGTAHGRGTGASEGRIMLAFGGVPAHADDQAEVQGEGEPPQGVPAGLAGERAAEHRHGRDPEEVEHDQHDRHQLVLAEGEDPGQDRVPDAGVAVRLVHRDAERGGVPVERVQREPVIELPVIPRRRHQPQPGGELGPVRVGVPGHDEQAEVALGPDLPAGQGEPEPAEESDDPRNERPVQRGP